MNIDPRNFEGTLLQEVSYPIVPIYLGPCHWLHAYVTRCKGTVMKGTLSTTEIFRKLDKVGKAYDPSLY